ncbi:hypothetical protein DT019_21465 [Streptomyces sp. SDr-06]|uniref:hypothetical protein n=1 Tax=Streptomyces sp. SDr-06 TaxID=2267702 RepID=UPI000DE8A8FD|nr:hypothetical protein [Streptomyces sp. SDr-06]RCH66704.1 hypothetical protein DT019_21465 [Streptomyces sp. SDr-06]
MAAERVIVVYPPDEMGGRRVRVDGTILGRAQDLRDLTEYLRRVGLESIDDLDVVRSPLIEWRGGGPEDWDPV